MDVYPPGRIQTRVSGIGIKKADRDGWLPVHFFKLVPLFLFFEGERQHGEVSALPVLESPDECFDHLRVELGAAGAAQFTDRFSVAHAPTVRPVRRHGVISIGYGDESRKQRDGLTRQSVGVPEPSQFSWWCRMMFLSFSNKAIGVRMSSPMVLWLLIMPVFLLL